MRIPPGLRVRVVVLPTVSETLDRWCVEHGTGSRDDAPASLLTAREARQRARRAPAGLS